MRLFIERTGPDEYHGIDTTDYDVRSDFVIFI